MAKKEQEITCTVEFTEGAIQRITDAFVDMYYGIKNGFIEGPLLEDETKDKPAQAGEMGQADENGRIFAGIRSRKENINKGAGQNNEKTVQEDDTR